MIRYTTESEYGFRQFAGSNRYTPKTQHPLLYLVDDIPKFKRWAKSTREKDWMNIDLSSGSAVVQDDHWSYLLVTTEP